MYNSACPIQGVTCRPPRVRYNSFLPMYTATFITVCSGQYWTSGCLAPSSTYRDLICDFFSSGRGFARFRISVSSENIRLPSDSISRWTPLPSANASYCQVRSGLSPPSCYPCQVHQKKTSEYRIRRFCIRNCVVHRIIWLTGRKYRAH